MEVIDVKTAKEYVMGNYPNDPLLKHIATSLLDQLPKVDAEKVVYCQDCARCCKGFCTIRRDSWKTPLKVGLHDFCSDGERKKDHE
jgi:hypothetical protein